MFNYKNVKAPMSIPLKYQLKCLVNVYCQIRLAITHEYLLNLLNLINLSYYHTYFSFVKF